MLRSGKMKNFGLGVTFVMVISMLTIRKCPSRKVILLLSIKLYKNMELIQQDWHALKQVIRLMMLILLNKMQMLELCSFPPYKCSSQKHCKIETVIEKVYLKTLMFNISTKFSKIKSKIK